MLAVQALAQALMRVVQSIGRTQKRGLKRLGYDLTTVALLDVVATRGPIHPTHIAEELNLLPSSVTRQVQLLEEAGHVAVVADPKDGRSYLIEMTVSGREELQRLHDISIEAFALLIRDWEVADIERFTSLLTRFADGLPESQSNQRTRRNRRQKRSNEQETP